MRPRLLKFARILIRPVDAVGLALVAGRAVRGTQLGELVGGKGVVVHTGYNTIL